MAFCRRAPEVSGFGMSPRTILSWAGALGFTGVILGALGAHTLHHALLVRQTADVWHTAVLYHLIHAVALLALAGLKPGTGGRPSRLISGAAVCWLAGVVLFSGSLYALALGAPAALGPVTPLGGLLLITGWLLLIVAGWRGAVGTTSS